MKLTRDEEMLALLYGDGTLSGLVQSLTDMRKALQKDEKELACMTDGFLQKLSGTTEEEFKEVVDGK